jgi:hypothetical protein
MAAEANIGFQTCSLILQFQLLVKSDHRALTVPQYAINSWEAIPGGIL